MSRFIGPIHHWLHRKIKAFESLEKAVVEWGKTLNLPVEDIALEGIRKFGPPMEDRPLEEIIDNENIHGWLQDKITRAELRHGYLITMLINEDNQLMRELKKQYFEEGKKLGKSLGNTLENTIENKESPKGLYDLLHDFLLEGMPCDRVTEVIETSDSHVHWIAHQCVHEKHWTEVRGDIKNFYDLRDRWIEGFVIGVDPEYRFERVSDKEQLIILREE